MTNITLYFQCLLGMQCREFSIIAADQINTQSIVVIKNDVNKLYKISDRLIMGLNGDPSDVDQLSQYILRNTKLYKTKNKYELSSSGAVHFCRHSMAESLRTGTPYGINILLAGYDDKEGGFLHSMDFLATMVKVPYGAHGFGGLISMSILHNAYRPDLKLMEAYEVMKNCVQEIHRRLFMNLPNFKVQAVTAHGIIDLPTITPAMFVCDGVYMPSNV